MTSDLSHPGPATDRPSVVVEIGWQDTVLHVATLKPGQSFGLGERRGGFPVPREALVGRHQPVVVHRRGLPHLVVPARARGSVTQGAGRALSLEELRPAGTFRSTFTEAIELALEVGAVAQIELGDLTVRVSRLHAAPAPPRLTGWRLDRRLGASVLGSAIALVGLLVCCRQLFPPLGGEGEWEHASTDFVFRQLFHEVAVVDVEVEAPPLRFTPEPGETEDGSDDACRCHEPQLGDRDAQDRGGRFGVQGPRDNPDPHISRYLGKWAIAWCVLIGWTAPPSWAEHSPTAPWGRDDALGQDPMSARGGMWGEDIHRAHGTSGLGLRLQGGVAKQIVTRATEPATTRQPPRIFHANLRMTGPVARQELLQTVATRFPQLTGCYERRLAAVPGLGGRLDVELVIRADGTVGEAHSSESSIPDPELTACVLGAFRDLSFSAHEAGPTRARYPLFLEPGTAVTRRGSATPPEPSPMAELGGADPHSPRS